MDAGTEENLPRGVLGKRLPAWLRPSSITEEDWKIMRPDLAILPDKDSPTCIIDKEIWLLELGYCSDINHANKFITEHAQHASLVNGLQSAGYLVHYICSHHYWNNGYYPSLFSDFYGYTWT